MLVPRPRGWHLHGAPRARRRRAGLGEPLRLRPRVLPQRARSCSSAGRGRTSTCRSSRAISRRGSGTTRSSSPRTSSASTEGTIRATVLIETILAAFEMEEILYELRDHASGLNAGRWDYIFSAIKKFRSRPEFVLPDRAQVTMTVPFMRAYTELLVATCHRRGAHAMGGMAAFIPSRKDPEVNEVALGQGARGQGARGGRRLRRHLGRAPRSRARGDRGLRRRPRRARRTRSSACATTSTSRPPSSCRFPTTPGEVTDDGRRHQRPRRDRATWTRGCAASARRRSTT